jgi:hypothetical protein
MEAVLKHLYGWHGPLLVDQGFISHLGWALALPLFAYWLGGPRWMLRAALAWIAYAFFRELVEEPIDATTVSDIVSRVLPAALLVAVQLRRRRLIEERR